MFKLISCPCWISDLNLSYTRSPWFTGWTWRHTEVLHQQDRHRSTFANCRKRSKRSVHHPQLNSVNHPRFTRHTNNLRGLNIRFTKHANRVSVSRVQKDVVSQHRDVRNVEHVRVWIPEISKSIQKLNTKSSGPVCPSATRSSSPPCSYYSFSVEYFCLFCFVFHPHAHLLLKVKDVYHSLCAHQDRDR